MHLTYSSPQISEEGVKNVETFDTRCIFILHLSHGKCRRNLTDLSERFRLEMVKRLLQRLRGEELPRCLPLEKDGGKLQPRSSCRGPT